VLRFDQRIGNTCSYRGRTTGAGSRRRQNEIEPLALLDAGDEVLVVLRERGRMGRDGIEVVEEFSHSLKLRDGRMVEWRRYNAHEEGLEALGLRE
jgi:ketosteroid isomerase-like protein